MNIQQILQMTKASMVDELHAMERDTVQVTKENLLKYFIFLEAMEQLPPVKPSFRDVLEKVSETVNETVVEAFPKKEEAESLADEKGYLFERKLKGGYVQALKAFVPETVVRRLGLEHGDYVKAKEIHSEEDESTRYYYEVLEKGEKKEAERIEINYGLVEKDGHLLMVKKTLLNGGEPIRLNDTPHAFLIRDEERVENGIQEGDIVDIAYMKKDPSIHRVIWKHAMDEVQESKTKEKIQKVKIKNNYALSTNIKDNILRGKHVLVVGCEPRKSSYKAHIEERGGVFSWAEGIEGKKRLKTMVQKVDVVVLLIRFIRHRASQDVVDICKEINVPFTVVENLALQSMLSGVMR